MTKNHGPIPHYRVPKKKAKPPAQRESFWLKAGRESFTRNCAQHFQIEDPENKMLGVQFQSAKRHGTLS